MLKDSTVGIIGLGLMGGSLAMRLKGGCARLIGFDSHPPTLELALSKGIIDQTASNLRHPQPSLRSATGCFAISRGERRVDLLIIATPVPAILGFLEQLPFLISNPCIILDVGSTKQEILQAMSALPENFDPIGGHPICGREKLGLENADPDLYVDAPFVVTPLERTTKRAQSAAQQVVTILGANLIEMTPEEHDRILASTSHLPFLIASALSHSIPQEFAPLVGPGFQSTSRLADTPSQMMMGILKTNRKNILDSLEAFKSSLSAIESLLEDQDDLALQSLLDKCRNAHQNLFPE